jgi:hypothetical protein
LRPPLRRRARLLARGSGHGLCRRPATDVARTRRCRWPSRPASWRIRPRLLRGMTSAWPAGRRAGPSELLSCRSSRPPPGPKRAGMQGGQAEVAWSADGSGAAVCGCLAATADFGCVSYDYGSHGLVAASRSQDPKIPCVSPLLEIFLGSWDLGILV